MSLDAAFVLQAGRFSLDVALEARDEIVVLFGASGAGKSLTLRAIAGLVRPSGGRITLDGDVLFDAARGIDLPAEHRRVGYVVQELALFPHLPVWENVAFALPGTRPERRQRAEASLGALGLEGVADRDPGTLSGGQRQRVALARVLVRDARLLLLDEPFSALDDSIRRALRLELRRLQRELGRGVIFVTHDLREAYLLADRLAVLDTGRVLQSGTPDDVFSRPRSRRVAELLGVRNLYRGIVVATAPDSIEVEVGPMRWRCASWVDGIRVGDAVDVAVRSERVVLRRGDRPALNAIEAVIELEEAYGSNHLLHMQPLAGGPLIEVDLPARPYEVLDVATRKQWLLELPPPDLHVMPATAERVEG
ncbi:MAG: ABC transporter ATP-binding protein [Dehalococcoidia bacterium]|nr:MAG: ABC transporter ATP-binding protein [Dehalococcoidia bacterium]